MDIINSYCKPQQRADRWKMSENLKFSEKYLRKNGTGAASAQGKKSKFWPNMSNEWLDKSPSFMALAQTVFDTDKKKHRRRLPPPPQQ